MDEPLPLAETYQRLLGELSRRLGAAEAELLLRIDPHHPPRSVARYYIEAPAAPPPPGDERWMEIPISDGPVEVGLLRMAFVPGVALPGASERGMARALIELAALLVEEHHQLTWGPLLRASRRMLSVTEEELQRIVLDIHDGPVQKLFVVSSHLALLQARVAECQDEQLRHDLAPTLDRLSALMDGALREIRSTLSSFRMAEFQQRGLASAIEGLAMQHESLTGNPVELFIEADLPPVTIPVKIALYRVLQEALSNAYRHAGVDRHEVWLRCREGMIELEVIDDGRGFDPPPLDGPAATERQEHIGLRGMRERVHLVGGLLQVVSRPGEGTRVIVKAPAYE
jgi:signal transduction histidine kinase